MTLTEIASAIHAHLKRLEADADFNIKRVFDREQSRWVEHENGARKFYMASCYRSGSSLAVKYVSYQGSIKLTREEGEAYLKWLESGNKGTHRQMQGDKL